MANKFKHWHQLMAERLYIKSHRHRTCGLIVIQSPVNPVLLSERDE